MKDIFITNRICNYILLTRNVLDAILVFTKTSCATQR